MSSLLHFFVFCFSAITCAPADDIYDDQVNNQWFKDGVDLTKLNVNLEPNTKPAKNVILFLGIESFPSVELIELNKR